MCLYIYVHGHTHLPNINQLPIQRSFLLTGPLLQSQFLGHVSKSTMADRSYDVIRWPLAGKSQTTWDFPLGVTNYRIMANFVAGGVKIYVSSIIQTISHHLQLKQCFKKNSCHISFNGPAPCYRLLYTCMYGARYFNQLWAWRVIN